MIESHPRFVPVENRPAVYVEPKKIAPTPSNPLITPTLKREVPIARSLKEMGFLFEDLEGNLPSSKKEKKVRSKKEKVVAPIVVRRPPFFLEAHKLGDAEFIRYTASMNIHDKGAKALFYANGGAEVGDDGVMFADRHATLAFAFDALRRIKRSRLAGLKPAEKEYKRNPQLDMNQHKVYVSPLVGNPYLRAQAQEESKRRSESERWRDAGNNTRNIRK